MEQHQIPEPAPDDEVHMQTPVIDIQDLEHKPSPHTRVSNKGVKIEPHMDSDDERDLAKEDETAIQALEELERQIRRQAPG